MTSGASNEPDRGAPFSFVTVATLLGVGITAFCAFMVLAAFAPEFEGDSRGGSSALSRSAIGFAGLVELLRALEIPVLVSRVAEGGDRPGFLVLTPPAGTGATALDARLRNAEASLVVLPKWDVEPDPDHAGWVLRNGLLGTRQVDEILRSRGKLSRRDRAGAPSLRGVGVMEALGTLRAGPIESLQTLEIDGDVTPLVVDDAGRAVLARLTASHAHPVYVLADPDLMSTRGLKDIATARVALSLVERLRQGAPVTFDVTLNGFGRPRSLLRLLFEPPLIAATLCGAASALLILAMALRRFGPADRVERVLDFGKRALVDNSAGLIALARREPAMARPYAELMRTLAIRAIAAPEHLDRRRLDALLDAASAARGLPDRYGDLARNAAAVRDRTALVVIAARLRSWSREIRRGRR